MRLLFILTHNKPHIILFSNNICHKTWCGELFKKEKNLTVEVDLDIPGICEICLRSTAAGSSKYFNNFSLPQRLQDRLDFTRKYYREEDTAPNILGASTNAMQEKAIILIKHESRNK